MDNNLDFASNELRGAAVSKTTLVVSDTPSNVVYDILFEPGVSEEEIVKRIATRTFAIYTDFVYFEIIEYLRRIGLENLEKKGVLHSVDPTLAELESSTVSKTTTLMISDVPSKVVFNMLFDSDISEAEMVKRLEKRIKGGFTFLSYSEMVECLKRVGLENLEKENVMYSEYQWFVAPNDEYDENNFEIFDDDKGGYGF